MKYTKINTLYKRYEFSKEACPEKKWLAMRNKIILGNFSDDWAEYLKDLKFDCFSKIDGTNTRIIWWPGKKELTFLGKTDDSDPNQFGLQDFFKPHHDKLLEICSTLWPDPRYVPATDYETKLPLYTDGTGVSCVKPVKEGKYTVDIIEEPVTIYGELYGKGIGQAGKQYSDSHEFRVFDVCAQGWWYPISMLFQYADSLGLTVAPYLGPLSIVEAEEKVKAGFKTLVPGVKNPDMLEEGIVARPIIPIFDSRKNRIIVKIKTKDYQDLDRAIKEIGGEEEYEKFKEWYRNQEG